jgi:hypothetical protein
MMPELGHGVFGERATILEFLSDVRANDVPSGKWGRLDKQSGARG